jgi:hypothetical protein
MKRLEPILLVLLITGMTYLFANQQRLKREIAALMAANQEARDDAAARQTIDPDEMRALAVRLEQAELNLAAAERRVTNALANTGYSPARTTALPDHPGTISTARLIGSAPANGPGTAPATDPGAATPEPVGPVSSSHGADGQLQHRSWGPEQVVGPPDTTQGGDIPTAWAPRSPQGSGEEWLHLGYEQAVEVAEVRVRETYNPGAVSKVAAVLPNGQETVLWEGTEPPGQAPVDRSFSVPAGIQANQIKVYLDRQRSPGWNEIDAVELVGRDGSHQWAASAMSSSSYAER